MQMAVVAITLPSLLLVSRTSLYGYFRIGGAILATLASIAWISERRFHSQTPLDSIMNTIARHGFVVGAAFLAASLACRYAIRGPRV